MPKWLYDVLISIGGSSITIIGTLAIFKTLLFSFFEKEIDSCLDKNFEKYKNKIKRSTMAYEILLEHEMRFYDRLDLIFAELIPLLQDLFYYMKKVDKNEHETKCEQFRKNLNSYAEIAKKLKGEILIHQSYIPKPIYLNAVLIVNKMQNDIYYWAEMMKCFFKSEYEKIDYEKGKATVDALLLHIADCNLKVKKRLKELSK